jgi:hypothetical protein
MAQVPLRLWLPRAKYIAWAGLALSSVVGTFVGIAVLEFYLQHSKPRRHKEA